jgi:competence protein ComEC
MGHRPLLAASVAFSAGAFFLAPWWVAPLPLAFLFIRPLRAVSIGLALGLLRGSLQEAPRAPGLPPEFEARIVTVAGERATVRAEGALVALSLRGVPVHRGDLALLGGRAHVPPPLLNPGGRDRRKDLAARGIGLEGSAEVLQVLERGPGLWRWLDGLRERFAARAAALCAPEQAALLTALAVGDRHGLSATEEDELSASGLVHLLASSGLHLFIIAWLVREAVRRLWLRTPWAASVRAAAMGAIVALPFACAEVLLLGAPWPAVRAGAALAVGLLAAALARQPDGPTTLFFAAAVCALLDPAASHDLALQLSVAGIAGLLLLARPLRELLPIPAPAPGANLSRRGAEHFLQIACSTTAAALVTAPLLAASFHRISLVSVGANAIALLPGLAAIPVATALVAIDAAANLTEVALPLWWLGDLLATVTLRAAHFFSALPFATISVAAPGLLACALWYTGVALLSRRPAKSLACFSLLGALGLTQTALARFDETMTITFLAVGQGDCAVVQLPFGHALLIDAGGDLRWPGRFDPGAHDVLPALAELGISRLDLAVLTHPHPDHAGGLLAVLDHLPVGELWMNEEDNPIARAVRAKAGQRGIPVREPRSTTLASVRLEVLSRFEPGRSTDDNSIVLRLTHRQSAVLFAGDAEALAESELAQKDLRADLLKAPHHGSRTSSTDAFLRRVAPRFTVYSTGAGNPFGFPMPEVVERTPGEHFNTAGGAVVAHSDGRGWTVHSFREGN